MQNQLGGGNKNTILAIALSIVILLGWSYLYEQPRLKRQKQQLYEKKNIQNERRSRLLEENEDGSDISLAVQSEPINLSRDKSLDLTKNLRVKIKATSLEGSFSLKGARFDDLVLVQFKDTLKNEGLEHDNKVVLLQPTNTQKVYFAEFGVLATDDKAIDLPNKDAVWKLSPGSSSELTDNGEIHIYWINSQNIKFSQIISVDQQYMFSIMYQVENLSSNNLRFMPFGRIYQNYHLDKRTSFILHEGVIANIDSELKEVRYKNIIKRKKLSYIANVNWLGFTSKYWMTSLIPDSKMGMLDVNFRSIDKNNYHNFQVDFLGKQNLLKPKQTVSFNYHFFAGAKELSLLEKYSNMYNLELFDRNVDFGILYFLTKPMFKVLNWIKSYVGNLGWAIIILTILLRLILFPVANKSFKEMAKMKKLRPLIKDINEQNKNDRMAKNKEMLELHKKHQIKPLAGCLPILIQIPLFFALYKVLFVTIEMRHAPFIFWIKDLSVADPTTLFNLFGLLSYIPPKMLMIGVLPILTSLTMALQHKLNPTPMDPMQEKIFSLMPYVLVFVFAGLPAGLLIYWIVNNTLSMLQQYFIMRVNRE